MVITLSVEIPALGDRLKQAKEAKGMGNTELAAKAGMSSQNLWRIENEKSSVPVDTLLRLASALDMDLMPEIREAIRQEWQFPAEPSK